MSLVNGLLGIIILIFLGLIVLTYYHIPLYAFEGFDKALDGVLLLSSISFGFYGACLSVLASIFNTKAVKEVMEDKVYRREFIIISLGAMLVTFLTVISTIIYQVLLSNTEISEQIYRYINAFWLGTTFVFLMSNFLFIAIIFNIFLSNGKNNSNLPHVEGKVNV